MLDKLTCSGFKSLQGFSLEFRPGLNILVGPNGSGKTNIIIFLEFLSRLRNSSLIEAVSKAGGAGRIFRRKDEGVLASNIVFSLSGHSVTPNARSAFIPKGRYFYEATLSLQPERSRISFTRQRLYIEMENPKGIDRDRIKTDISIVVPQEKSPIVDIRHFDLGMLRYHVDIKRDNIEILLKEMAYATSDATLFDVFEHLIAGTEMIGRDLDGAISFNIDPNKVRENEDIATPAYIQSDGIGFAATLNALQPNPYTPTRHGPFLPHISFDNHDINEEENARLLNQIISYSSLVNRNIVGLTVKPDTIESRLSVFVHLRYESSVLRLPISLVSDGTAKWLALATAVITKQNVFAIEEPENFLHPNMQTEIINLVRMRFEKQNDMDEDRFALISTHSETILNACKPEELIMIEIDRGTTTAKRIADVEEINAELRRTGFGIGYYYLAGVFG